MKTILETPRLVLREMVPTDLDFLAAMLAHPEVMRYYPKCYSREEAEGWLRRTFDRYAQYGHGWWLVLDRATGEPRGQVGLLPQTIDDKMETEIGYMIHRSFWRQGLASEAAAACRDYAFNTLQRERVIAQIRPENLPSQGVARKIGMAPGPHRMFSGFDHTVFSLTRADWELRWRTRLQPTGE
jgi:RimJ/RimL family protein N-acetyltransferase